MDRHGTIFITKTQLKQIPWTWKLKVILSILGIVVITTSFRSFAQEGLKWSKLASDMKPGAYLQENLVPFNINDEKEVGEDVLIGDDRQVRDVQNIQVTKETKHVRPQLSQSLEQQLEKEGADVREDVENVGESRSTEDRMADDGTYGPRFEKKLTFREDDSINNQTIYLYKAYYDPRDIEPTIRVSFNALCEVRNITIAIEVNGRRLQTTKEAVTGSCPDAWARGCKYNGFDMISEPYNGPIPKQITVHVGRRSAVMDVEPVIEPSKLEDGITICIEPFYWFNDYIRLLVFLETWKLHGAKKFLFYYTTINEHMAEVLDAYVKKGEVDLREWPLMPRSEQTDPNPTIYRLMEHLVEHDCTFRSRTKYTSIIDVDEFILPNSTKRARMLDTVNWLVKEHPKAGSFFFSHTGLQYDPPLVDENPNGPNFLKGLHKPVGFKRGGPGKLIYLTEFVKLQQTHRTRRFFRGRRQYQVSGTIARLFHSRINFVELQRNDSEAHCFPHVANFIPLPKEQREEFRQSIIVRAHEILGEDLPVVNREIQSIVRNCVGQWRTKMHNCKTPITGCVDLVEKKDTWIYAQETENSHYTLL